MTISASQLKTFRQCPRLWAFAALEGKRPPTSPSAALGSRVHEILADWLRAAKPPVLTEEWRNPETGSVRYPGAIAAAALSHLPRPPIAQVERRRTWSHEGVDFILIIDVIHDGTVFDHKTTTDLKWALDEEGLAHDAQALLYLYATGCRRAQWTYITTHGRLAVRPVRIEMDERRIAEGFAPWLQLAKDMECLRTAGGQAMDIPGNAAGCDMYGGCSFRNTCNMSAGERVENIMAETLTIAQLIEQQKARIAAGKTPPAPKVEAKAPPPPVEEIRKMVAETPATETYRQALDVVGTEPLTVQITEEARVVVSPAPPAPKGETAYNPPPPAPEVNTSDLVSAIRRILAPIEEVGGLFTPVERRVVAGALHAVAEWLEE